MSPCFGHGPSVGPEHWEMYVGDVTIDARRKLTGSRALHWHWHDLALELASLLGTMQPIVKGRLG